MSKECIYFLGHSVYTNQARLFSGKYHSMLCRFQMKFALSGLYIGVKVKESRYRPGVAQRVPES